MPSQQPPEASRTLCELQCRLVTAPSGTSGTLPGPACPDADLAAPAAQQPGPFAPAVKCPSLQWPPSYAAEEGSWDSWRGGSGAGNGAGSTASLRSVLRQLVGAALGAVSARLERLLGLQACPPPGKPVAWHPRQPLLAAVDGGSGVALFDYAGHLPVLGHGGAASAPPPLQPLLTLQHEFQQGAAALAWRPHGGKAVAVGVAHGACLWHLGRPPAGSGSRSSAAAWMTWFKAPCAGAVTTLAWHPQACGCSSGHLLAGASPDAPGFFVWDVATGTATPISAGPEPTTLLRWSPCGTYLLSGHPGGDFRVWETQTWWSQSWAAAQGGGSRLVDACWGPDSRALLLAYDSSPQLVSLHFTAESPSLQAQLLPLPLAELSAKGSPASVRAVAWDPKAQRLAVALGGAHPAAGCVALYDTRCDPILSARFIGFMRLGPLAGPAAGAGGRAAEPGWEEIQPEEVAEATGAAGGPPAASGSSGPRGGSGVAAAQAAAAEGGERPALAFLPGFQQGAVLAARSGDHIAAVPLYFAA